MELADVVVPRNEIARFVRKTKEISEKYQVPVIVYGHAGDGNVHMHPVCLNMDTEEWSKRLPRLMSDIYRAGISLGGAVSGEHGIGFDKKEYFYVGTDSATLTVMKDIKRAFDPNNILNPGKFLTCRFVIYLVCPTLFDVWQTQFVLVLLVRPLSFSATSSMYR